MSMKLTIKLYIKSIQIYIKRQSLNHFLTCLIKSREMRRIYNLTKLLASCCKTKIHAQGRQNNENHKNMLFRE